MPLEQRLLQGGISGALGDILLSDLRVQFGLGFYKCSCARLLASSNEAVR